MDKQIPDHGTATDIKPNSKCNVLRTSITICVNQKRKDLFKFIILKEHYIANTKYVLNHEFTQTKFFKSQNLYAVLI